MRLFPGQQKFWREVQTYSCYIVCIYISSNQLMNGLTQIISNDKFRSVDHRVLANRVGPRISVACFLTGVTVPPNIYGPIEDLLSEESPRLYKEFTVGDYMAKFFARPIDKSGIDLFKL